MALIKPKASISLWVTSDFWTTLTVLILIPVLIFFIFKKRGR